MGSEVSTAYLLVTGSRRLTSHRLVATALDLAWAEARGLGFTDLLLVHGAAPGADSLAEHWYQQHQGPTVDRKDFKARWSDPCKPGVCSPGHRRRREDGSTYCPAAGNYRNQEMVDFVAPHVAEGAALQLVFFADLAPSNGTADCARRAEAAGIPARVHHETTMTSRA